MAVFSKAFSSTPELEDLKEKKKNYYNKQDNENKQPD
jgi:hypothetical protein